MTTQPSTDAAREVTQEDREAASRIQEWNGDDMPLAARMLGGQEDNHPLVQAFTCHRLAERERAAALCEAQAVDFLSPDYATGQPLSSLSERFACKECAAAIRSDDATRQQPEAGREGEVEILRRALAWHGDPQRMATTREEWQQVIDDAIVWVKANPEPDRPSFSTLADAVRLAVPTGVGRGEVAREVDPEAFDPTGNFDRRVSRYMRRAVAFYAADRILSLLSHAEAGGVEGWPVAIWSGEHRAYWRKGADGSGAGYTTDLIAAGLWQRVEAKRLTGGCGPEKLIALHDRPASPAAVAGGGHD